MSSPALIFVCEAEYRLRARGSSSFVFGPSFDFGHGLRLLDLCLSEKILDLIFGAEWCRVLPSEPNFAFGVL